MRGTGPAKPSASIIGRPSSTIPVSSNSSERAAAFEAFGHHAVVVSQQTPADDLRRLSPFNGARATMLVPLPRAPSIRSSPSTRERRCFIPASPRFCRACFGVDRNQRHCPPRQARSATDRVKLDLDRAVRLMAGRRYEGPLARPCKTKGHGLGRLVDVASSL